MAKKIKFTDSQERAIASLVFDGGNLFLTGAPGTGKSFVVNQYLKRKSDEPSGEQIAVVASTGAAALLIDGRTFHSFFGMGIMEGGPEATFQRATQHWSLKRRLRNVGTVIIDEISMLSASTIDCAERIAREIRGINKPWGGLRIIAVGDFAQLPPISKGSSKKEWAFLGEAWRNSHFMRLMLKEIVRTHDESFLRILGDIRWGHVTPEAKAFLDDCVVDETKIDRNIPRLFPLRNQTENFNHLRLTEISHPLRSYETEYGGDFRFREYLIKNAPILPVLDLKKDALVMFRVNDQWGRFINGTVGIVTEMDDESISVAVDGQNIDVTPHKFIHRDADGEEVAYAKNFPLHLAWANTIHKVQGATLEHAHINLQGLWEPGHAYVALSRVRTGKNITLVGWDRHSIKADPVVRVFYEGTGAYEP